MTEFDYQEIKKRFEIGYTKSLGSELVLIEEGRVVGEMMISENHKNPMGTVHGGALFTLADTVGGAATRTLGVLPTTCSSTINYMRPTIGCTKITADARVLKCGKNTSVVEISLCNQDDEEVARVLATYFNLAN